ncbi:MAG: hypothetical protein M1831_002993 [Alyxoria varia]|nr:MAG: hypothetical protein M1831_002993 [Alyxoria varia]
MSQVQNWQQAASKAQNHRDESLTKVPGLSHIPYIPPESENVIAVPKQVLSAEDISITEKNPEQLLACLASRELSSVAVTTAFLRRAALAQKLTNCVTEVLPERALDRARNLDEYIAKNGRPSGPLHGLPISVKEHIGMKGLTLNGGFCSLVDATAEADATILQILHNAGAVFHVRTTEPQTLMHLETSSNLYGVTPNPHNSGLTAGGSSGGEGALQALRGSVLGIGSDIGGSIRAPAANNGLYGLKPSCERLPVVGLSIPMMGNEQILGTCGPISTSLFGLKVFMKSLIDAKPWISEPWLNPLPWTDWKEPFGPGRKLRVAVMWDDGVVKPHPPITRAMKETVHKLSQNAAIEVTEWKPWRHDYAWDITSQLYFADGGKSQMNLIDASGEPLMDLSRFMLHEQSAKELNGTEIWALTQQRNEYRAAYNDKWNQTATGTDQWGNPSNAVDVILCPAGPGAAPPLNCSRYWAYTSQWNLLDYSALTFPVTKVHQAQDHVDQSYVPQNDADRYNYDLYAPEKYINAPVSLQLVARRYEEEKLLAAMEYIANVIT